MYIFHNISFCYVICWYETNSIYKLEFQFKNTSTGFFICIYIPLPHRSAPLFVKSQYMSSLDYIWNFYGKTPTCKVVMSQNTYTKLWCHQILTQSGCHQIPTQNTDVTKHLHTKWWCHQTPHTKWWCNQTPTVHTQSSNVISTMVAFESWSRSCTLLSFQMHLVKLWYFIARLRQNSIKYMFERILVRNRQLPRYMKTFSVSNLILQKWW